VKKDNISSEKIKHVSNLIIECDNFDVIIKKVLKSDDLIYKLSLKKGYNLEDISFSSQINKETLIYKIQSKKDNISGTLELNIPKNIESFWINVINGDINVDAELASAEFNTINGDINLWVANRIYKVITKTTNGDVNNSIETNIESKKLINCTTINGDINIQNKS
jgi:hypothetical protein